MSFHSSRRAVCQSPRAASYHRCREARGRSASRAESRGARLSLALLLLFLYGATCAAAVPLSDYRERVRQAVAALDGVRELKRHESAQEHTERMAGALNTVLRLVPIQESIELDGGQVPVNNSWLEEEYQSFQQVPRAGDPRAAEILTRISERLRALDDRLAELEPRGAASVGSKAEEKKRLQEILNTADFKPKPPEKTVLQRIWEAIVNWLKELFGGGGEPGSGQPGWFSFIAMILVFGLAAGAISYAVWKLVLLFQGRKKKTKAGKKEARVLLGERLAPDQKASDLLAEAEALARAGEIRAAIRKGYIALLCELGDRKVLTLAEHKTNRDYLRAVREKRLLLDRMQKLTNSFEDHWYGFRQATIDDWAAFRSGYQQTLQAVPGDK
ncbi:MAG TPA: DUF4129 domain-containing protein [Pyrinomonadaceae bacterium]